MDVTFPNESPQYRAARNKLLQRETALRREMEAVAAEIRALPPGGAVPQDYEFDHIDAAGAPAKVRLSELFRPGTDALILYHYMFPRHRSDNRRGPTSGPMAGLPLEEGPCPSCTALLDNGKERCHTLKAWEPTSRLSPRHRSSRLPHSRLIGDGAI